MATIEKRSNQKGASYVARWRDQSGIGHKKAFKRKKDAEVFMNKTMAEVHSGEYSTLKEITFAELSERYLPMQETEVRERLTLTTR
jgi:hypothetical protein